MSKPTVLIVDYGAGNLRSVMNAFEAIGHPARVTSDPRDLREASAIVLPGVGAFGDGMKNLEKLRFVEALNEEVLERSKPYLGICLGLEFLGDESFEGSHYRGLGWIKGSVKKIAPNDRKFKIPHIGWNDIRLERDSELFAGMVVTPAFYFVHSYHLEVAEAHSAAVTATCWHGTTVTASVEYGNIYAVQFHPEKSQEAGLKVLENFVRAV